MNPKDCIECYTRVLKQYADFNGRARRREYWLFALMNMIVMVAILILTRIAGFLFVLYPLYCLAVLVPSLAVAIRRLHDTGRSGWWILVSLIPFVGWIPVLIFLVTDSQPGVNEYGPNPKGPGFSSPSNVAAGAA